MSVIMMMQLQADPGRLEAFAAEHADEMRAIAERAKEHGVIAHRFYGGDGRVMVVDEWPDEESFQRFFGETQSEIGPMFEAVGATGEPQPTFWRTLETHDEVGWEGR